MFTSGLSAQAPGLALISITILYSVCVSTYRTYTVPYSVKGRWYTEITVMGGVVAFDRKAGKSIYPLDDDHKAKTFTSKGVLGDCDVCRMMMGRESNGWVHDSSSRRGMNRFTGNVHVHHVEAWRFRIPPPSAACQWGRPWDPQVKTFLCESPEKMDPGPPRLQRRNVEVFDSVIAGLHPFHRSLCFAALT